MPKLQNTTYLKNYFCNHPTQRKTGVAILLASKLEFQEIDIMRDPQGRYLFLKGYLNKTCTLASIYVPNKGQAPFLRNILSKLQLFAEGTLILGGDFNVPLDLILDSSTGHSSIPQRSIRSIRRAIGDMDLVDCWRTLNPQTKDYTWYSALHNRYSRIDYVFIRQIGLPRLCTARIDPATWSDHGAVHITMESPLYRPAKWMCRLNEALL
ncbi:Hypothetical predicted protein, partial [Pelobates cultripes]